MPTTQELPAPDEHRRTLQEQLAAELVVKKWPLRSVLDESRNAQLEHTQTSARKVTSHTPHNSAKQATTCQTEKSQ